MTSNRSIVIPAMTAALLLAAVIFAIDRYSVMDEARTAASEVRDELGQARELGSAHADVYGMNATVGAKLDLKHLVQEAGAKNGVSLLYLSETERDAGESIRERNVFSRLVNVPHDKFVAFLTDLELRGGGARIKEIRVKQATDKSDTYVEAEAVLSTRWLTEPASKELKKEMIQ